MDPITLVVGGAVALVGVLVAAVKKSGSSNTTDSSSNEEPSYRRSNPIGGDANGYTRSDKYNGRGGPGPRGGR